MKDGRYRKLTSILLTSYKAKQSGARTMLKRPYRYDTRPYRYDAVSTAEDDTATEEGCSFVFLPLHNRPLTSGVLQLSVEHWYKFGYDAAIIVAASCVGMEV
jgi:hypothetical protein